MKASRGGIEAVNIELKHSRPLQDAIFGTTERQLQSVKIAAGTARMQGDDQIV